MPWLESCLFVWMKWRIIMGTGERDGRFVVFNVWLPIAIFPIQFM